ncbi:unnamed protein product [Urochloa humidicola]
METTTTTVYYWQDRLINDETFQFSTATLGDPLDLWRSEPLDGNISRVACGEREIRGIPPADDGTNGPTHPDRSRRRRRLREGGKRWARSSQGERARALLVEPSVPGARRGPPPDPEPTASVKYAWLI